MPFTFLAQRRRQVAFFVLLLWILIALSACGSSAGNATDSTALSLPDVPVMVTDGRPLRVLATTSIIGDVVGRVGDDAIELTVLIPPGQDPHSYQPGAVDLAAAADADLIFVNGWNLEEGLVDALAAIGDQAIIVPISAGIEPRQGTAADAAHEEETHDHGPVDPHVWQDVAHVINWTETVRQVLSAADPAHAETYAANATAYGQELAQLDNELRATLAAIPDDRRVLVTNHDNLGYFADAYGFEIAGAVIPSVSSLAEPTAAALAALVETMRARGVCAVVVESSAGDQLARTLERELTDCDRVRLITLYTDALGPAGSGADSYVGMMRANAAVLVEGLGE